MTEPTPFVPARFQQGKRYETFGGKWLEVTGTYHSSNEIYCEDERWRGDFTGKLLGLHHDFDQRSLIPVNADGKQQATVLVEGIPGVNRLPAPAPDMVSTQPFNHTETRTLWDYFVLVSSQNGIAHYRKANQLVSLKQNGLNQT